MIESKENYNEWALLEVIDNVPHCIFWKDRELVFRGCNTMFSEQFSYAPSEIVGKKDEDLFSWGEELADKYREDDLKVIETGEGKLHYEEEQQQPDGSVSVVLVSKVPYKNQSGDIVGVLGIYTNITERKKMERSLIKASSVKSEFIANMSHDLRTPMTGVMGMLSELQHVATNISGVIKKDPVAASRLLQEMKKYIGIAQSSSDELLNMFNDILEVIRLESGEIQETKPEHFSLWEVIKKNHDLLQATARHKGLILQMQVASDVPQYLYGSRRCLDRILVNLLGNALKFTEEGTVTIRARLLSRSLHEVLGEECIQLQLSVEDTGVGIPADKFEEIFGHFSRLTSSYQGVYKGSGLGLYSVKRYVEEMGGSIRVESELGEGSRFILELPFVVTDHEDFPVVKMGGMGSNNRRERQEAIPHHNLKEPPTDKGCILLTEDNLAAAMVIKNRVKRLGYDVEHATSGEEAVDKVCTNHYSLVLMDVGLPGIDGLEASKQIRALSDSEKAAVPIIALTGHADKVGLCLEAGMQAMLEKPASESDIESVVARYIKQEVLHPVFDWGASVSMCGGEDEAREIIQLCLECLFEAKPLIDASYAAHDVEPLRAQLHKIRGGVCYLQLPELQESLDAFHDTVKESPDDLDRLAVLYERFQGAQEHFIQACKEKGLV